MKIASKNTKTINTMVPANDIPNFTPPPPLVKKSGFVGVKFGIETISPETLKGIGKNFVNLQKAKQLREWCRTLDIWTHAAYTFGLPGDNKEKAEATIKFAFELDTDSAQFSIATPFPGTPFYEEAKRNGWLITSDWTRYDGSNFSVVSYPWMSAEEIEKAFRKASIDWRLKKEGKLRFAESLVRTYGPPRSLTKIASYIIRGL